MSKTLRSKFAIYLIAFSWAGIALKKKMDKLEIKAKREREKATKKSWFSMFGGKKQKTDKATEGNE